MSESFSAPASDGTAEPDVESNEDQVEPGNDAEFVGRVQGVDEGSIGEQGAEARAAAEKS